MDDVPDCAELIDKLANMDMVAYAGRSVGGNGVFAIVPIAYPQKHVQQWESLRRYFDSLGITVDPQTKDVARLRICSYDPEARVRFDAVPYKGVYTPPQPKPATASRYYGSDETEARVSECCQQIAAFHTDLTKRLCRLVEARIRTRRTRRGRARLLPHGKQSESEIRPREMRPQILRVPAECLTMRNRLFFQPMQRIWYNLQNRMLCTRMTCYARRADMPVRAAAK